MSTPRAQLTSPGLYSVRWRDSDFALIRTKPARWGRSGHWVLRLVTGGVAQSVVYSAPTKQGVLDAMKAADGIASLVLLYRFS